MREPNLRSERMARKWRWGAALSSCALLVVVALAFIFGDPPIVWHLLAVAAIAAGPLGIGLCLHAMWRYNNLKLVEDNTDSTGRLMGPTH